MATAYTSLLGLALPVTGELSGTWGDTVNNSITSLLDSAVAGTTNVSTDTDVTLTTTNGVANTAREAILLFSGARTALRTVTAPAQSKIYTIINATTGGFAVKLVGAGPTTGVTIANGSSTTVAWNGSDFVEVSSPSSIILPNGTANGVLYLNGSKVVTSGSALTFDGSALTLGGSQRINGTTTSALTIASSSGAANGFKLYNDSTNDLAYLMNFYNGSMIFGINNTEQMRLTSTGLGIGTSSPAVKLDVAGNATIQNGVLTVGKDTVYDAFINTPESMYFNVDSDANSTGNRFVWGTDRTGTSGGTEWMRLDSSGNLGLGVTPSAWATYKALQISNSAYFYGYGDSELGIGQGAYYNGGWKYSATGVPASWFNVYQGVYKWNTAPSGTAGNAISFTQAMTLDSDGDLGIGVTSPAYKLDVKGGTGNSGFARISSVDSVNGGAGLILQGATSSQKNWVIAAQYNVNGGLEFTQTTANGGSTISSTPAMTLDASGNLSVATTSAIYSSSNRGNITVGGSASSLLFLGTGGTTGTYLSHTQATGTAELWNGANGPLIFATNNTERARIDSSGNLLVGTTSAIGSGPSMTLKCPTAGQQCYTSWNATTAGNPYFHEFGTETAYTARGSITYNRAAGLVAYNTTSDYRAKDISGPVVGSGEIIDSVPVYMGKIKGATQERPMFIAHETPEYAHTGEKDAVDTDGNPVYQQMDASALIPVMWAEIQSLRKRLADAGI